MDELWSQWLLMSLNMVRKNPSQRLTSDKVAKQCGFRFIKYTDSTETYMIECEYRYGEKKNIEKNASFQEL